MSFDPTLFPGGPGYLVTGGNTFQAKNDSWKAADKSTTFAAPTNLYGGTAPRRDATMHAISLTPIATAANLAALLAACIPYRKAMIGQTICPASDVTGVIQTKFGGTTNTGESLTYPKFVVTKMAKLTCAANLDLLGETEWTGMVKSGAFGTAPGDFYVVADSAYAAPPSVLTTRLYDTYTLAIGGSGAAAPFLNVIVDKTGIEITPTVKLELIDPSLYGPTNYKIDDVTLEIAFKPMQMTIANFLTLFPAASASVGRGQSASGIGQAVTVMGSGAGKLSLTVPNMSVKAGSSATVFDRKNGFVDKITLEANLIDGADLFALGVIGGPII